MVTLACAMPADAALDAAGADVGDGDEIDPAISCAACEACCCRLEVMLMGDDDVPVELTVEDRWGGWVMRRLDDGWCAALNRATRRCGIYERRPGVCRDYPMGGGDCVVERSRYFSPQAIHASNPAK